MKAIRPAWRKSRRGFAPSFDAQFQFIGLLDVHGTLLAANTTLLRFAGLHRQEVLGRKL